MSKAKRETKTPAVKGKAAPKGKAKGKATVAKGKGSKGTSS